MIIPTGNPSWTRTATAASYGAHPGLHDYGNTGAINANTDVTASQYKRLCADLANAAMVAPLATMSIRWTVGPQAVFVSSILAQWADPLFIEYAGSSPPSSVYPTVTISGTTVTISFPGSASDTYGVSGEIVARLVVPFDPDILWAGPNGTSVITLTSSEFNSSNGSSVIQVY